MGKGPVYTVKELLARLVSFDTTSHKTNLRLIHFVEDYLAQHGIGSTRVTSEDGDKANLFATIGPDAAGGIALSGHTDVVPVADQAWDSDPFRLLEKDGRLFGRGSADMKGFLACVLAFVPEFSARALATPIHIVLSYDEEIGCVGVRPLIDQCGNGIIKPSMVIVGEPTSMNVVEAHKGPVRFEIHVTGRAAHSSMAPLGVNAISYASELLSELRSVEEDLKGPLQDERFDPPYPTLQVTTIEGGSAGNIVPASCTIGFDVRVLPGLDVRTIEKRLLSLIGEKLLPRMQHIAPEANIRIVEVNNVPPFEAEASSNAVALALKLTQSNQTFAVSYATEAGLFQDAGMPAVVCGPGDIAQAHTANEWIAESELERCTGFLHRLADWAEGPA